jgi:hypothetical protein
VRGLFQYFEVSNLQRGKGAGVHGRMSEFAFDIVGTDSPIHPCSSAPLRYLTFGE